MPITKMEDSLKGTSYSSTSQQPWKLQGHPWLAAAAPAGATTLGKDHCGDDEQDEDKDADYSKNLDGPKPGRKFNLLSESARVSRGVRHPCAEHQPHMGESPSHRSREPAYMRDGNVRVRDIPQPTFSIQNDGMTMRVDAHGPLVPTVTNACGSPLGQKTTCGLREVRPNGFLATTSTTPTTTTTTTTTSTSTPENAAENLEKTGNAAENLEKAGKTGKTREEDGKEGKGENGKSVKDLKNASSEQADESRPTPRQKKRRSTLEEDESRKAAAFAAQQPLRPPKMADAGKELGMHDDISVKHLAENGTVSQIHDRVKAQYRTKALIYHPDKNDSVTAAVAFGGVQQAREELFGTA